MVTRIKYKYNFIYITNSVFKAMFNFQDTIFSISLIYQVYRGAIFPVTNRRNENWIGQVLRGNYFLEHVMKGKTYR
jgi:hypothetical protein